mmetsp:Transcript_5348/g.6040  ORF Transcript_5348/g.6040 Transcript_5348/m.6040 type:complete len:120 (-) Transcript_5348:443-802(-)
MMGVSSEIFLVQSSTMALKAGPVFIADVPAGTNWADKAREELQRRIEAYTQKTAAAGESAAELRFNLMAIVANRLHEAENDMARARFLRHRAHISLVSQAIQSGAQAEAEAACLSAIRF